MTLSISLPAQKHPNGHELLTVCHRALDVAMLIGDTLAFLHRCLYRISMIIQGGQKLHIFQYRPTMSLQLFKIKWNGCHQNAQTLQGNKSCCSFYTGVEFLSKLVQSYYAKILLYPKTLLQHFIWWFFDNNYVKCDAILVVLSLLHLTMLSL